LSFVFRFSERYQEALQLNLGTTTSQCPSSEYGFFRSLLLSGDVYILPNGGS
jgi:hypothetical protein